jgi:beta-N-acetylhexosaminidase
MSVGPGELLALGFEGTALPDEVVDLAAESGLGGVVLFARNCPSLDAVLTLTEAARALGPDVLVLVDHEGGRVHRLPPPFTRFPPAATIGASGDAELAAEVARAMARELRAAGFDSGLTPVLDCLTDPRSVVIGDRAYAGDPEMVAACGVAFVHAALAEGLVPVAKHFPGHGRTPLDSHLVLPEVAAPFDELERVELGPFRQALAAGCPAVLVAHVRYPALDAEWPASLSAEITGGLLRGRLGFSGLVLSDDLEMAAVRAGWGVGAAAARFLAVGGDLALVCRESATRDDAVAAVGHALRTGTLSQDAASTARERRAALRRWVEQARPRPDLAVIGSAEHRALLAEVLRRAGERQAAPDRGPATS